MARELQYPRTPSAFVIAITTFDEKGTFDEGAFRFHCQRMVDAGIGFMAPDSGVRVAYGGQLAEQGLDAEALEAKYAELINEWDDGGRPWGAAGAGYIDSVIDPRDTRFTLIQALEVALGRDY